MPDDYIKANGECGCEACEYERRLLAFAKRARRDRSASDERSGSGERAPNELKTSSFSGREQRGGDSRDPRLVDYWSQPYPRSVEHLARVQAVMRGETSASEERASSVDPLGDEAIWTSRGTNTVGEIRWTKTIDEPLFYGDPCEIADSGGHAERAGHFPGCAVSGCEATRCGVLASSDRYETFYRGIAAIVAKRYRERLAASGEAAGLVEVRADLKRRGVRIRRGTGAE